MKTVVITGASRGIGRATAERFLSEGWKVFGTSTSGKIDIDHDNFTAIKLDLSIAGKEEKERFVAELSKLTDSVDVLVNNAGVLEDFGEDKVCVSKLRKTLEVNLFGLVSVTDKMISMMKERSHIINVSSMVSSLDYELPTGWEVPAYRISKASVNMYTVSLAQLLGPKNIVVSSLDPGWVRTDMGGMDADRAPEDAAEDIFNLATKEDAPTGKFWREGKVREW